MSKEQQYAVHITKHDGERITHLRVAEDQEIAFRAMLQDFADFGVKVTDNGIVEGDPEFRRITIEPDEGTRHHDS